MKKRKNKTLIFAVVFVFVLLSLSFASANIFSDLWGKFTGKVIDAPSITGNAVAGAPQQCISCAVPPTGCSYSGGSCTSCGTLVGNDGGPCTGGDIGIVIPESSCTSEHDPERMNCILYEGGSFNGDTKILFLNQTHAKLAIGGLYPFETSTLKEGESFNYNLKDNYTYTITLDKILFGANVVNSVKFRSFLLPPNSTSNPVHKIFSMKIYPSVIGPNSQGEMSVYPSFPKFIDCNQSLISPFGKVYEIGAGGCNPDGKMSFGVSIQNYLIPQIIKKEFGTWKVVVQGENSDMGYFSEGKFIYSKNPKISLLKITPIMFGNDFEGELKVYTSFPKFIDCNYFLISPSGNQIFSLGSGGCNSDGKMSFGVSIQNYLIPQIIKKEFGTWKVVVQGENSDMGYFSEGKFIYFSPTTQKSSCNSNGICTLYEKEFHEGISVESISKEGVKLRMGGDNKSEGEVTPLLNKGGEYIFHQPIGSENKGDLLVEILSINPPTKNIDRWSVDFRITNLMSQIRSFCTSISDTKAECTLYVENTPFGNDLLVKEITSTEATLLILNKNKVTLKKGESYSFYPSEDSSKDKYTIILKNIFYSSQREDRIGSLSDLGITGQLTMEYGGGSDSNGEKLNDGFNENINKGVKTIYGTSSVLGSQGEVLKGDSYIELEIAKGDNSLDQLDQVSGVNSETNVPRGVSSEAECLSGCFSDGTCYPLGYRMKGSYCSSDKTFVTQLGSNLACENSFECGSNLCVNNQCVDQGLFQKILNWFSKLFGGSSA